MANWTTRLYQKNDEKDIRLLYEKIFDVPMPLEMWRWRYLEFLNDRAAIILAVSDENLQLAGQYALCSLPFKLGGEDVVGALSLDTMVHPDFRGQRMFTKLAEELYELFTKEIAIVYGFPNKNSHHGFIKYLGWKDLVQNLPIFVRPLRFSPLLSKFIPPPNIVKFIEPIAKYGYKLLKGPIGKQYKKYSISKLPNFDERFDNLWIETKEIASIMVRRDSKYLNWRYSLHPSNDYTILAVIDGKSLLGYAVLRIQDLAGLSTGFIVDMLVHPSFKFVQDALIEGAVQFSEEKGCDMVTCLMLEHVPYVKSLKRRGFMRAPSSIMPQELYLGVRNNDSGLSNKFIHDSKNWYITWGDHDRV